LTVTVLIITENAATGEDDRVAYNSCNHGRTRWDRMQAAAESGGGKSSFGIVCANISAAAVDACRWLGDELAAAYDGVPLPDGRPGRLDFTTRAIASPPDRA
jgi:hypothetical protein